MLKIILWGAAALLATMPSFLIGSMVLRKRGEEPTSDNIVEWGKAAKWPIALNFVTFAVLGTALWFGLSALSDD